MKQRVVWLVFLLFWPFYSWGLALHGLKPDELALWVGSVEQGTVLESYRADVPVAPASTMKLLTTWAALLRLTPNFQWKTSLLTTAPIHNGILQGDLYWRGMGDPVFDQKALFDLLYRLRLSGVNTITGKLILDNAVFDAIPAVPGFEHDAQEIFMIPPDAHSVNQKTAKVMFFNQAKTVKVVLNPPFPQWRVYSSVTLGMPGNCSDLDNLINLHVQDKTLLVDGKLPSNCSEATMPLNILDHRHFSTETFRTVWRALGGKGKLPDSVGTAPSGARELVSTYSPPLAHVLWMMNKLSNNTTAQAVYLTLGQFSPEQNEHQTLTERAQSSIRALLRDNGMADQDLVLENGSGLSRKERLSAHLLGALLVNAAKMPYATDFMSTLPVAGERGTLKLWFLKEGPRLRMKTGTLKNVRSLAGYWQQPNGERLAIVAIINSDNAVQMKDTLQRIVADQIQRFRQ